MNVNNASKELVKEFYNAFNSEYQTQVEDMLSKTVAKDWKSYGSNDQYRQGGRDIFVDILKNFHKAVPDLKWEIKEILEDGNRYIVRSNATGTPKADFLETEPSGKSFEIITIDIHTIENGQIVETFHCEDWHGAIKQFAK